MLIEYKEKLQKKLTDSMVKERTIINQHFKDIQKKGAEVKQILENVTEISAELEEVKENEQAFLKQQMEEYYIRQQQELQPSFAQCTQQ